MSRETCTIGLNGKGEAREMFMRHNWIPYIYRRVNGTRYMSRTFFTDKAGPPPARTDLE
jgi:hypothetical protein